MAWIDAAELCESPEEMVMRRHALRGDEAAHGKRVNQCIVEMLVLSGLRSGNGAHLAYRRLIARRLRLRLVNELPTGSTQRLSSTASPMKRLGKNGAVQMIVEVGAFRHALEEDAQRQRIAADGIQLLGRALP